MAKKRKVIEKEEISVICNHRNMHYTNGVLICTLPKGHKDNHGALLDGKWAAWSDAAGIPVKKHV